MGSGAHVTTDDDPFAAPVYGAVECPDCGGRDGHYIHCLTLAEKHGICPKCWLARPCDCEK
jgi:hypothetical protein